MRIARGTMLAIALVACAWFVVGIRQTRETNQASAIVTGGGTLGRAAAVQAGSLLKSAGWLNPDSEVDVLRGQLALEQNDTGRAGQILADVTRREPMNVEAWVLLAQATSGDNHALFEQALGEIVRLDPPVK